MEPKVRRIKYPIVEPAAKGKSYRLYESIMKFTSYCLYKTNANCKNCYLFQHVAKCDSYFALFPNAINTRDEKTFQAYIVQCNNDKTALSYGCHDWTNMWTGAVLPTTAKFLVRNMAILYCGT
jgi:hypothetical protein